MEHFTLPTAEYRVSRGVMLLDRLFPNWHREVNLYTLDINNYRTCIVAQVFGDGNYSTGVVRLQELGVSDIYDAAQKYGFAASPHDPHGFDDLTAEWVRVVRERQADAGPAIVTDGLADWERELLAPAGVTVVLTRRDGTTVSFDNVLADSVGPSAERHGTIGIEYADGSSRVTHVPFVSHWEFSD